LLRQAGSLLEDYVSAVTFALREAGASHVRYSVAERSYLDASLQFHCASSGAPKDSPTAPTQRAGWSGSEADTDRDDQSIAINDPTRLVERQGKPAQQWATLEWAEDTGWSLTHPSFALEPSAWRFLDAALVPAPEQVAAFVRDTVINPDRASRLPVRFRHRSQPLQLVIDQLATGVADALSPARFQPCDAELNSGPVSVIRRDVEAPAHRNREPDRDFPAAGRAELVAASRSGPSCPALWVCR
jgi:hypothetical protein